WNSGSVEPVDDVGMMDGTLTLKRTRKVKEGANTHTLLITRSGEDLSIASVVSNDKGDQLSSGTGKGHRLPALPARPDISKVSFGEPVRLIHNSGLEGWKAREDTTSSWSVQEGILSNRVSHEKGKRGYNLQTKAAFEDFRLTTEVRILEKSNSGIYLRGVYEIQIINSHGKPVDSHNMGALYSRITPLVSAEKPFGEWQTLDITLVDHHVTVVLNGQMLIDNQPALGCTGGALTWDDSQPGPIMLQGDHSDIDYRNMVIYPVKK
ncbi:MAG: hypothetical protein RL693_2322, partial [Verrucomicrobiota bacterium]